MKAIQYTAFGGTEVIKFVDIDKPQIGDDEVLIKGDAASVNPADIKQRLHITLPYIPGLNHRSGLKLGKDVIS